VKVRPVDINWHPGLPIFASERFLKGAGDEYGWLGGVTSSGELRCVLPYTVIRKASFRLVRFRVETISLGGAPTGDEEREFLNGAIEHFRAARMDMIIPPTTNTIFQAYPEGAIAAPYGTYIVDLTETEETLWTRMHSKHRNVVRNASKKGVQIREGLEFLDTAYELVRDTVKRSRLGFMDRRAFGRYVDSLGDHVKVMVADHEGTIQGCAVIPFSLHSAYYVYGGTIERPLTGAMNLLHWEAIRQFRSAGVHRYDFVGARIDPDSGSKQAGLAMFKERFGGTLVRGFMWKYPFRHLKFAAYSLAVRLLRGGDVIDQERHKLRAGADA
jgi:hypothetical protein